MFCGHFSVQSIITLQDKNMNIIRANQAAFDFFQMEPGELLGATCYSLFRQATGPCEGCPGLTTLADIKKHTNIIEHPSLGTIQQLGPVARFSKTPATLRAAPPLLGEHTDNILREEFGYHDSNITQLRADGVI